MKANAYINKNESTIKAAFARFEKQTTAKCLAAMEDMCEKAMLFALDNHDEKHWKHKEVAGSYGWIVLKDKQPLSWSTNGKGGDFESIAAFDLEEYMCSIYPNEVPMGWVGVIVAGMDVIDYFSVDFETETLYHTQNYVKEDFKNVFNSIKL